MIIYIFVHLFFNHDCSREVRLKLYEDRMSSVVINDGLVQSVTFYVSRHWILRLDVLPFAITYATFFALVGSKTASYSLTGYIGLPVAFGCHLLLFLLSQWSHKIRCHVGSVQTSQCEKATQVHVVPCKNAGYDKVVDLNRFEHKTTATASLLGEDFSIPAISFQFQKVDYNYVKENGTFERTQYPTACSLGMFLTWSGLPDSSTADTALRKWGRNEFDIPLPNFLDMYLVRS